MLSSVVFPLLVYSQSPSPLIAPTSVDFGTIISSPSPSQTIILIYAHPPINAPLTINSIQVSSPFKEVTSSCSGGLPQGQSCSISVQFAPTIAGTYSGRVTVNYKVGCCSSPGQTVIGLTGTYAPRITGYVNPKYVIVGVTYAPPGPSSNVTYSSSTLVGNTTATTDSYTQGTNLTVSVTGGIGAWTTGVGNDGGFGVKITGTESTDYSQTTGSSNSVTISKQTSVAETTNGTGKAFAPVNHDYDTIWLWLNPLMIYTVDPNNAATLVWNGYGYDNHDLPGMDVVGILVGWLNGHFGSNPSINAILARSWVTTNEPGLIWPAGEGPGLTKTDISQILQSDPFTSGTYSLPSPLPATSADGRFTQIPFPPNPITYSQAGIGNGGGITTKYDIVNTNTSIVGKNASHSFMQAFGVEAVFSGGVFLGHFSVDVKTTQTLTWKHTWENLLTTTNTLTKSLSVTGPGCPQTSPPCVPVYTGPGEFIVYQDNLYGTFMFYPK